VRPRTSTILISLSVAGAALQLWLAHRYFGFLTGDDLEIISEAFRVATGYRSHAWDIRNLFVPQWVVAPPIWIATKLGINDVGTLIQIATLPFIAAYVATIWLVHRLALRWTGNDATAVVAAALYALHWIPLAFGSTVYPRTLATLCIVAAAVLIDDVPFIAGLLVGVAFADRFSEIVFLVPLLLIAKRRVALLAGVAASVALTVGVHDWIVWGAPFSSLRKFAHLTLIAPDFASRIKYQSPVWYLETLPRWCAFTLLPLLWRGRRDWRPFAFVIIPIVALSMIRHKEVRYLQGVIPFLAIAAAIGFTAMANRRIAVALLAMSIVWDLYELKVIGRKSNPAVMAARSIAAKPDIHVVAVSQIWAYGGSLYLGDRGGRELETPPRNLDAAVIGADAVALYETDLDQPQYLATLKQHGFKEWRTFRDGRARAVVVFTRSASGTSGRARR
jgi:hypothetical protein